MLAFRAGLLYVELGGNLNLVVVDSKWAHLQLASFAMIFVVKVQGD